MEVNPSEISPNSFSVILFHAPFCGHCRRFKPIFDTIQPSISKCGAKAYEVNVEQHPNPPLWMTAGQITTVPRIVILRNGKSRVYNGERDIESISSEVCGSLSGGSNKQLPHKLQLWRKATMEALGKFSIPKKGTSDYNKIRSVYDRMK